jgi:hypothetical protein
MRKVLYIFGLLTDADIEWMARTGTRRRLRDGEVLIMEGQSADSLILLLEGELLVTAEGLGQVARLGVGEIVGEVRSRRAAMAWRSSLTEQGFSKSSTAMRASAPAFIAHWRCSSPIACVRPVNPRRPVSRTKKRYCKTNSTSGSSITSPPRERGSIGCSGS